MAASPSSCPPTRTSSWVTTGTTRRTAATGVSSSARRSGARRSSSTGPGTRRTTGCAGGDSACTCRDPVAPEPGGSATAVTTATADTALAGWVPTSSRLGVYVHLPFCAQRCGYCSFNTAPYSPGAMDRFLAALCAEIDIVAGLPWAAGTALRTIFVGGGTPSLATEDQMAAVLEALRHRFALPTDAEITVECNP